MARLQELGARALAAHADVGRTEDIARLFGTALESFGRIDIVIADAGLELTGLPALDFTEEQFDRMFSVNTKGAFFTLQAAGRHVVDNGKIIYISSSTTGYPNPGYALHGGSKVPPNRCTSACSSLFGAGGSVSDIVAMKVHPVQRRCGSRLVRGCISKWR